jgi:ribulose-5-phosphate 4-epimerase/fuculose-1-phosphate aldolase
MTMRLRDELVTTAKRMSSLGLTPGMSGNVSVRSPRGLLVTPSGMPYADLVPDDCVELDFAGVVRPGARTPTSEWRLHRDILASRADVTAIVHTHSLFCTTVSALRRPIPAIHYMVVLANSDEIPCAEYATFGSAELALNAVAAHGRTRQHAGRRAAAGGRGRDPRGAVLACRAAGHATRAPARRAAQGEGAVRRVRPAAVEAASLGG